MHHHKCLYVIILVNLQTYFIIMIPLLLESFNRITMHVFNHICILCCQSDFGFVQITIIIAEEHFFFGNRNLNFRFVSMSDILFLLWSCRKKSSLIYTYTLINYKKIINNTKHIYTLQRKLKKISNNPEIIIFSLNFFFINLNVIHK